MENKEISKTIRMAVNNFGSLISKAEKQTLIKTAQMLDGDYLGKDDVDNNLRWEMNDEEYLSEQEIRQSMQTLREAIAKKSIGLDDLLNIVGTLGADFVLDTMRDKTI